MVYGILQTDSAKRNGLFDWSAREGEDYKNASIDLYGDGYEVEVYPSSNDDDMQTTTTETLMDAINFVRGVLSSEGAEAPAPGEDPTQMELPLEEYGMSYGGGRGVGLAKGIVDWDKDKKEAPETPEEKAQFDREEQGEYSPPRKQSNRSRRRMTKGGAKRPRMPWAK